MSRCLCIFAWLAVFTVRAQSLIPLQCLPATGTFQGIAGVAGGIDQYSTNYVLFCNVTNAIPGTTLRAFGDGLHDDTAAINFAVNAAPNGSYVYLPTGNYLISAPISRTGAYGYDGVQHPFSIIIRGDGPTNTIILNNGGGSAIYLGSALGWGQQGSFTGATAGATNIGINTQFPPVQNQWIMVDRSNTVANVYLPAASDPHPFYYVYGGLTDFGYGGGADAQLVKITGVNGNNNYNIWPPLNEGYGSNDILRICFSAPQNCGIENLCVVQLQENKQANVRICGGQECWVRNVESRQAMGYHISLEFCGGCEVRGCFVHEPFPNKDGGSAGGGSDYGIVLGFHSSSCLVEDNIALHCRHSFIMETAAGQDNVISYNFGKDNLNENLFETDWQEDTDYHGGEPRYCLWEGNVVPLIEADGVEGATKYDTFFRNLVTRDGLPSVKYFMSALDIDRGNYFDYFLNNAYLPCGANSATAIYEIGHWQSDLAYTDANVITNCVWSGNYDFSTGQWDSSGNGVINWSATAPSTFPDSLLYSGKPAWFGDNAWPPIGLGQDLTVHTNPIPAQIRAASLAGFSTVMNDGYALAVATTNGAVAVSGSGTYFNNAIVALSAAPANGYKFTTAKFSSPAAWGMNTNNPSPNNTNTVNVFFTMPPTNLTATVNFLAPQPIKSVVAH